tara:strand:+ start:128501 stop:128704 length:204 start_codon:yes stop_codon:yes gene_type:complete
MLTPQRFKIRIIDCLNTKRYAIYACRGKVCKFASLDTGWVCLKSDFDSIIHVETLGQPINDRIDRRR